jgi:hypothetical protein
VKAVPAANKNDCGELFKTFKRELFLLGWMAVYLVTIVE